MQVHAIISRQALLARHLSYQRLQPATHRSARASNAGAHAFPTTCSIRARWCIDIKYGVKMEAIALLEEWVQSVGSQAGLTEQNTTIMSGAVGVPESRLELEIEVDNLAQLEAFWGQIPPQAHKAWSQRAQHFLIDGSPKWEVFRKVATSSAPEASISVAQPATLPAPKQSQSGLIMPDYIQAKEILAAEATTELNESMEEVSEDASLQEQHVMLDWKGDPMVVNPGDKLPFNFR